MALWRVVYQDPDGSRREQLVAAGNRVAAEQRALRFAENVGARVVEGPEVVDPVKGTL